MEGLLSTGPTLSSFYPTYSNIGDTWKHMTETVCLCRYFGELLISSKNPKIGSRFTSIPILAVRLDLKKIFVFLQQWTFAQLMQNFKKKL